MNKKVYIVDTLETRLGFLEISLDLLEERPDLFETYLPDCEILSYDDHNKFYGRRTYKVRCPEFDELLVGDTIPQYIFTWNKLDDGTVVRLPVERV